MSGWIPSRCHFELTPTKARVYLRRPGSFDVSELLSRHGLRGVKETQYGWTVNATVGQIWSALSGLPSGDELFRHIGRDDLIASGFYTAEEYQRTCMGSAA